MIFQPGSGGSGGLSVIASGATSGTVKFTRPALFVLLIPRNIGAGGYTGVCFPGKTSMVSDDGTEPFEVYLDASGTELNAYSAVDYLALG